jgi:protease II
MSLNDPRVPHWSTLKFIEKLRDFAIEPTRVPHFGNKNIVVQINKDGGHFGSSDNNINLNNLAL